ncbi:N-acetyltransferase [Catellatospora sp. TT07R-123]|uniref:GNAT family N-acetyltransferase n=1 Tax=Catellatospora sp. TT07R-123 TaxID=2733863 RepID=UPI001B21FEAC|nr:GNAT family N-acetyltransferase [Catellatospora sp. TT07R-123]GHJ48272.1 N-acetyltransferase [Catellatospora sp. TT07R-123]
MADWAMRQATAADLESAVELRAVVLRADLERLGRYDDHRVRQRLRDTYVPANTRVIEVDGAFAGCVALRPADGGHWLEHFYLDPQVQGRGVGSAVLRELLEQCDRDGVRVRLIVLRGSEAGRLYARHGFTVASEEPVDVLMVREPAGVLGGGGGRS